MQISAIPYVDVLPSQANANSDPLCSQTRPIEVSEYWSTVLLDEWAVQASLERQLNLPISVVASADALIQAKGQIGFIDLFTLPLYEVAADVMPGMSLLKTRDGHVLNPPFPCSQIFGTSRINAQTTVRYGKPVTTR